jgi:predicted acyltransferase
MSSESATAAPPAGVGVQASPTERLTSLDAFRGITIAAMILVNNPGTWSAIYPPLRHAAWHGWTPTDLIFPFFLFIVGVAIVFAYEKRLTVGLDRGPLARKATYRAFMLFLLGMFMAAYPLISLVPELGLRDGLENVRIPGVLQRIAVCYLAVSLMYLYMKPRSIFITCAVLLFGYWAMMMLIPVPGYGTGLIDDPEGNLAAHIDRALLGGHLWVGTGGRWDPEGILSTLPAIASTIFGVWAGRILFEKRDATEKTLRMLVFGVLLVCAGYVWDWFFPINKPIWTSSYAVFTAGQAFCGLALCYWFIDVRGYRRWAQPFVAYGVNAITVFFFSGIIARSLNMIRIGEDQVPLQRVIFENVFAPLGPAQFASMLYAVAWITIWYFILRWMYNKRLFIKV